jgi:hypothetical protein
VLSPVSADVGVAVSAAGVRFTGGAAGADSLGVLRSGSRSNVSVASVGEAGVGPVVSRVGGGRRVPQRSQKRLPGVFCAPQVGQVPGGTFPPLGVLVTICSFSKAGVAYA